MDIPGGEEEVISMPISTSLTAVSDSSRLRLLAAASTPDGKPPEKGSEGRKTVRYRECQKNHAANLGGHVMDGCGEFMPSGEEGTPESLRCAACECHRNFHRREVEGEEAQTACDVCYHKGLVSGSNLIPLSFPPPVIGVLGRALPQIIAAAPVNNNNMRSSPAFAPSPESEEQADGNLPSGKKRFRTKFTHEQKERMLAFAQRVGWRLQKHEEAAVQSFCQEVGVKRHVLKVWMHNNKHAMATKPHADNNNHNNDNTAAANSSSNNSTP